MIEIAASLALLVAATAGGFYFCLRFGAIELGYGRDWRKAWDEHPEEIIDSGWPKIGFGLRVAPLFCLGMVIGAILRAIF